MFRRSSASVIGGHADRNLAVAAVAYAPIPTLIPPHPGNPARIAGDFHPVGFIPASASDSRQTRECIHEFPYKLPDSPPQCALHNPGRRRSAASDTAPQSATALTV